MSATKSSIWKWLPLPLTVAAVLILGVAIAVARSSPKKKLQEAQLKDGRVVQVAGVTVGPPHSMHTPGLRNALYHFMPDGIKRQLGPNFSAGFGFQHEGIGLWLMCYDPALAQYAPSPFSKVVIVDDHGCEMESTGSGSTSDGYHQAAVLHVSNFPREKEKLTFRLYGAFGGRNTLGEITVDNPVKAQRADWTPQALPIVAKNGEVSAKLNRIPPANSKDLEILVDGRESTDWSMQDMYFADSLGNAATTGQNLCRQEKAWKLKTRFMRTPYASFGSNEVWKVGSLKLPSAGTSLRMERTNVLGGVALTLRCINGPGAYTFSNGVCTSSAPWTNGMSQAFWVSGTRKQGRHVPITTRASDKVTITVGHDSLYPNRQFTARIWHEGLVVATAEGASSDGASYYYELSWLVAPQDIPPADAELEMDIIIQEGREFEFLVNPKDYQPTETEL